MNLEQIYASIEKHPKEKMIDMIRDSLDILTIGQFRVLTVNTVISQMNLSTGKIAKLDDLMAKDERTVRTILGELLRNVVITLHVQHRNEQERNSPLGF